MWNWVNWWHHETIAALLNHLITKWLFKPKWETGSYKSRSSIFVIDDVINSSLIPANFSRRNRRLKFVQIRKGRYLRDQQREIFHFGQMPKEVWNSTHTKWHSDPIMSTTHQVLNCNCIFTFQLDVQTIINQYTNTRTITVGTIHNLKSLYLQFASSD